MWRGLATISPSCIASKRSFLKQRHSISRCNAMQLSQESYNLLYSLVHNAQHILQPVVEFTVYGFVHSLCFQILSVMSHGFDVTMYWVRLSQHSHHSDTGTPMQLLSCDWSYERTLLVTCQHDTSKGTECHSSGEGGRGGGGPSSVISTQKCSTVTCT